MAEGIHTPIRLESLLADESFQKILPFPVSDHGMEMVRGAEYYVKP